MKKLFKVEVAWMGESEKTILADSYDEALSEIDNTNHQADDFINDDDTFRVIGVSEVMEEVR